VQLAVALRRKSKKKRKKKFQTRQSVPGGIESFRENSWAMPPIRRYSQTKKQNKPQDEENMTLFTFAIITGLGSVEM